MSRILLRQPGNILQYIQSWAFSLLFHVLAVGSAVVFLGDLQLEPQPEPFKWDVALVEAPQPNQASQAEEPALAQPPAQAEQVAQPQEKPIEKQVAQQEVRQEVQEVKEVKPVTQESPPPVQAVVQTVQPVEAPQEKPKEIVQTAEAYPVPTEPAVQAHHEAPSVSHHSEPVMAAAPSAPAPATAAPLAPVHEQAVARESLAQEAAPPIQEAMLRDAPVRPASVTKADYGWLAKALWDRVAMLKRYPHAARINHLEGRVVLRAVIRADGQLMDLQVAESSGHSVLDLDALEVVRRACPLALKQSLGRSHVVVQVPISYRLER